MKDPLFRPGVPDAVFALVLVLVGVGGGGGLLNDPGTYWHLRLGRDILRTGEVPRFDTFTFTRGGAAWVDQSWAFDAALAAVVDRWGWTGAIAATALGLAALYGSLARGLLRDGVSPLAAVASTVLAMGVGAPHFLVRPHLLTLAFVLWTLRICRAYHHRGGRMIWSLPALMVIWANVHGGFLAGPLIVATAGLGHALSGKWDESRRGRLAVFAKVLALSSLAPLVNPYGFGLYRHVGHLLVTSGVTQLIDEYQPIPFGQSKARIVEWVVLALIALPSFSKRRMERYDAVQAIVWLHLALGSIRHAPLFVLAAAPGLAKLLDGLPALAGRPGRWRRSWSAWPLVTSLAVALAVGTGLRFGGFDPRVWPLEALPILNAQPVGARLFHEQNWGGMIESECRPTRRTFVDDRFELFGERAIRDYTDAIEGGSAWDTIRDRERIELVWVRPGRGLARRLSKDRTWRVLHRDAVSVLFRRLPESEEAPALESSPDASTGETVSRRFNLCARSGR